MNAGADDRRIPDVVLERYRLGELPALEASRVTELLRRDEPLQARLVALNLSDEEIAEGRTIERLTEGLQEHIRARRQHSAGAAPRGWRHSWATATALGIAVVVLTVGRMGWIPSNGIHNVTSGDTDRVKGLDPSLVVYRRTASGSETLADGAVARPGDVVRVGYHPAGRAYGVIVSVDGRGAVTMHLPSAGDQAVALKRESTALLDDAYELDDAPQWERFYFVTCERPFSVQPVIAAVTHAASDRRLLHIPLALPQGLEQSGFFLQKEPRP